MINSQHNILTYAGKAALVEQAYFSPSAVVNSGSVFSFARTFAFLSRVDPWPNNNVPPTPTQDQKYIKGVFKNIFALKSINSNDVSPVIERINWKTGTVYDYYRDDVNMFEVDDQGLLTKHFYINNKHDQVFKCLWNNNGAISTDEPIFAPGAFFSNDIFVSPNDGYKWKYMYTVNVGLKLKFMDSTWMPVVLNAVNENPMLLPAGSGSIEVINVVNGGDGYDTQNVVIKIVITGDGKDATAAAVTTNGAITDIVVTNPGSNYTFANVSFTSDLGANGALETFTSPIGGHAFDPLSELGCSRIMFTTEFDTSENGTIPTDITFYQYGILINPISSISSPEPANGSIYRTSTDLIVSSGFGAYIPDETVYEGNNLDTASFKGTVLSFDSSNNILKLINTEGTPTNSTSIFAATSGTARTLFSYTLPDLNLYTGYISYIENRPGIQRSSDGIEQIRIIINY